jgi:hypothetical protein
MNASLKWTVVFLSVAALLGATASEGAPLIPLVYENGPNVGNTFGGGPLDLVIVAYDSGTTYPVVVSRGYSGAPTAPGDEGALGLDTVQEGVEDLDAIVGKVNAIGASTTAGSFDAHPGDGRREDTWGVGRVTNIRDSSGFDVWTPGGKGQELTFMFYGEQDFYVEQTSPTEQFINGVGMRVDFYLDLTPDFDQTLGSSGRTGDATYTTATDGTLVLASHSVPGFINASGVFGGLASAFESQFALSTLSGRGSTFLELDPGTTDYDVFNTDTWPSLGAQSDPTADFRVNWSITANSGVGGTNDWLVVADGPISASAVPEPSSLVLAGIAAGWLFRCCRRRRACVRLGSQPRPAVFFVRIVA